MTRERLPGPRGGREWTGAATGRGAVTDTIEAPDPAARRTALARAAAPGTQDGSRHRSRRKRGCSAVAGRDDTRRVGAGGSIVTVSKPTTLVDLLRHGEPVGGSRYRGQRDDPLNDKGWEQMRAVVGDHRPWDRIVSSTLLRCSEFARELSTRHARPLELDDRLKEIGFGAWEGRTAAELRAENPGAFERFTSDPVAHRPAGAESLDDFCARVMAAWNEVLARHAGQRVLIVAHAGVMRMVLCNVLEIPLRRMFRIHVPNACLTRFSISEGATADNTHLIFHGGRL